MPILLGCYMNLFQLESSSSALREHLPMVLFKLAVRKEVGNDRLLAALQFVELAPKKDLFYISYQKCEK